MDKFKEIIEGVKNGWKKMDPKKKMMMGSVVIVIFLAVSLFTYFNRVIYAPLFTNLELNDAGSIVEDLKLKKIDYKLSNGGKDILIDEKLIDGYRLEVATEGNMPEKSSGFEMFDNMGMMATDDDRKIMYQRALSGELQRSIMSLDAIIASKVHLVLPEKSMFETEKNPGSASVIVEIDPLKKIDNDTVRGIVALVYGAVENVPEENIQIIDSKGKLLSAFLKEEKENDVVGNVNSNSTMREDFQEKVELNLNELLGGIFGGDKVKVSVFADLDFDAEETTTISYSDPIARSEQVSSVEESGASGNIGDANSNAIGNQEDDKDIVLDKKVNNELTTKTQTTIKAPGKVKKLTTSIVYDGNLTPEASDQILSVVAIARKADTAQLINLLLGEHPQTIALIMCYIQANKAAVVLSEFPRELQIEVSERICNINRASPDTIARIESIMEDKFSNLIENRMETVGGVSTLVDILNSVDRGTEKNIIGDLEKTNLELAETIKASLFVFEDIITLDRGSVQRILREISNEDLALALKDASEAVYTTIFSNMSERASEMLKEDIEFMGPVRISTVEEAQQKVVGVIRRLEEAGEIVISRGDQDGVIV